MNNLNLLLSSSYPSKLIFNGLIIFDVLDRFFFFNFKFFNGVSIILDLKLPFSNSLLKFKNKIYLILYFLIFEVLFDSKPQIVPVYTKKNTMIPTNTSKTKVGSKIIDADSGLSVSFFRLSASSLSIDFLTLLSIFISKNTYKDLVVLSRFIKLNTKFTKTKKISSFSLKSATNVFEFLNNFEEFILSKAQLKLIFNFDTFVGLFLLKALGFNISFEPFKKLVSDKKFYFL